MTFLWGESKEYDFPVPLSGHGGSSELSAPPKVGFLLGCFHFHFIPKQNKEQNQLSKLNNERTPFSTLYILMLIKQMKKSQPCGEVVFLGMRLGGHPLKLGMPRQACHLGNRCGDIRAMCGPDRTTAVTRHTTPLPVRAAQAALTGRDAVAWAAYTADGSFSQLWTLGSPRSR